MPQKLQQIYIVIAYICIGKVAWFAVYICGDIWNALYAVGGVKLLIYNPVRYITWAFYPVKDAICTVLNFLFCGHLPQP